MYHQRLRYSFIALHLMLGIVIALQSLMSILPARGLLADPHAINGLAVFAAVEVVAAVLFLIPRTLRFGGVALLVIFAAAFVLHGLRVEMQWGLVVYAAGVAFVMLHGSAYGRRSLEAEGRHLTTA